MELTGQNTNVSAMEDRYSRQILFKEIGADGQEKLKRSRVVIVGCGATGSILASLLARAGVGTLTILDRDYVQTQQPATAVAF